MGLPNETSPFALGSTGGYEIDQSLRFDGSSSFTRTNGTPDSTSVTTFSCWIKKATPVITGDQQLLFYGTFPYQSYINFTTGGSSYSDNLSVLTYANSNTGYTYTNALLRDPSAWYHIVLKKNGTTVQWYINGELQSTTQSGNNGSNTTWNGNGVAASFGSGFNGHIAEVVFVDNQDLDPTNFGEPDDNGVWRPITYTGTFGSQGWYLKFDPSATNGIGHDHSGNGNNWTPSGFTTSGTGTDVMSDTPTDNFSTMNPVSQGGSIGFSEGNLRLVGGTSISRIAKGTQAVNSGKYYWELTLESRSGSGMSVGVCSADATYYGGALSTGNDALYDALLGQKVVNGSYSTYGASFTTGDTIGAALDADANTITFYKNGTSQGSFSITSGVTWIPAWENQGGSSDIVAYNFGQRAFAYTPPTGFKALNTANQPAATIKDGSQYFNTVLWTGNGSTQSITGVGFQPDWVWTKKRSGSQDHFLYDVVRGSTNGNFYELRSSSTSAEGVPGTPSTGLTSLDSDGFSIGSDASVNTNSSTYVAWNWLASNTSGSSNTDGTITSTISATPTAGFSIATFTGNGTAGATVGHGLGVQPKMVIWKSRNSGTTNDHWTVYHSGMDATAPQNYAMHLNLTNARNAATEYWNNTAPTSTVFSLGYLSSYINVLNRTYVAYCWAEVPGYSSFGSYSGNDSANGPFVYCGFKPAWVLVKRIDSAASWALVDNTRSAYNVVDNVLFPDFSDAESTSDTAIDLLSNGFKLRSAQRNFSGATYIYAAFAEHPFGGSNVSPATAR